MKHFDLADSYIASSVFVDDAYNDSMDKIDSKLPRILVALRPVEDSLAISGWFRSPFVQCFHLL